jgi:hypothetical protein
MIKSIPLYLNKIQEKTMNEQQLIIFTQFVFIHTEYTVFLMWVAQHLNAYDIYELNIKIISICSNKMCS